jgi:hypothetical protein
VIGGLQRMNEQDRMFLVEMAVMITGHSTSYCERLSREELEKYYMDHLGEDIE